MSLNFMVDFIQEEEMKLKACKLVFHFTCNQYL